jgi:putative ABC transport system permease protein
MQEVGFEGPVVWLLFGLMVTSTLMFGIVPALNGTSGSVDDSLRAVGRSATGSVTVRRLRRVLVGSQFAVATPLLVVAGLLLASLNQLRQVDLGFDSRNLITGSIRLPSAPYTDQARVRAVWDEMRRRLESVPGISAVAFADGRPPNGVGNINNFDLEDRPARAGESQPATPWVAVAPEYFRVLGLRLMEGRLLDERDALTETVEAVVVDQAWARRFFPNESAVGKRFREGGCTTCPWTSVVGIVSTVKYVGLDEPDQGTVYSPLVGGLGRFVMIRTATDAAAVSGAVRQAVRELEPGAPLSNVATIDDLVAESIDEPRSLSMLIAGFALIALTLSVFGIYGVMAYYVQQHLKDISIRMALGGRSADVLKLIVGQGMTVVITGVVAGLLAAVGLARLMSSLLYGVRAIDPLIYLSVSALLLTVALVGCLVPAIRALALQPATVLRNE